MYFYTSTNTPAHLFSMTAQLIPYSDMTFLTGINKIELQLDNHIDDTRHEDSFKGLTNLDDISVLV